MDKFLIPGVAFAPNCTSHSKGSPFVREGPRTHSLPKRSLYPPLVPLGKGCEGYQFF